MRLSPVFWYADTTGRLPSNDSSVFDTYKAVAGISQQRQFSTWWRNAGAALFEEAHEPNKLREVSFEVGTDIELYEDSLVIEVPLNVRRETLIRQFKRLLADKHEGRALNIAATTTAQLKLHTKRYQLHAIENQYWVLVYRLLYPNVPMWCIGDRLQIAPSHRVRGIQRDAYVGGERAGKKRFDNLNSLTGRYLYKARYMLHNAERGSFPCADKPPSDVDASVFPQRWATDFKSSTATGRHDSSLWHGWLWEQLHTDLRSEVIKRNRLAAGLEGMRQRAKLDKFMSGDSDEI